MEEAREGTPAGIGNKRVPPIFMQPGDCVSVQIDRIGTLENPIAQETLVTEG